ncbi:glycosyltransferase family 2 protein [Patescibacteria group bacterium]|nr:glycosyltransferase family 2 protein [Patescibacteria group bacterium]
MSISVVVIAKNAENIITRSLKSVQFADEVILVDIKSTDETRKIAEKYCTKIYDYKEDSRFVEPVRNYAFSKATKDWVLVLDADEEIKESLALKLQEIDQKDLGDVYHLSRKNIVSNYWMQNTGWWPDYQLRFFKNGLVSWGTKIHAKPEIKAGSRVVILEAKEELAILHHNYKDTKDYLARFDRYTDIEAEQKAEELKDNFSISQSGMLKAFSDDWFRRFFDKQGYKDGVRGFYLSLMQAAYQMTTQMKTFDLLGNKNNLEKDNRQLLIKDLRHFQKELNYWINDMEIKEKNGLTKLVIVLKRKLGL